MNYLFLKFNLLLIVETCRIFDAGNSMLDARYWILDIRYWILDAKMHRYKDTGYRDAELKIMNYEL
jgi:hypothetical protein